MGSGALVLVWSHPSTIAIQLYMSAPSNTISRLQSGLTSRSGVGSRPAVCQNGDLERTTLKHGEVESQFSPGGHRFRAGGVRPPVPTYRAGKKGGMQHEDFPGGHPS